MPRLTPTEVPRLDLAPKTNRPLSLRNPLDYLRLLYWVFYFPQALRWYVETFGGGYIPTYEMNPARGSKILRDNPVQRYLLLQGLVLTVVTPLVICFGLEQLGVAIDWGGVAFGVALGVVFSVVFGVAFGVVFSIVFGVAFSIVFSVVFSVVSDVTLGVVVGVATGVAFGVAAGMGFGVAFGVVFGVAAGMGFGVAFGVVFGVAEGVVTGVLTGVGFGGAFLRLDSFLMATLTGFPRKQSLNSLAATTQLPIPWVRPNLKNWLRNDWETGIKNTNQLLAYSMQFAPVVQVINSLLITMSDDQIIYHVAKLAENPFDWSLIKLASARFYPFPFKGSLQTDTPAHATAAGFWLLHDQSPAAASQAFEVVRDCLYGQEMHTLAISLTMFQAAETVSSIATIEVPNYPQNPLLRPITWKAMQRFCNVVSDAKSVANSVSRTSRAFASNRALGELKHILDYVDEVPEAERQLIENIAKQWRNAILDVATAVGEQTIEQPIQNPYVVGDPVEGSLFVGRDDILRQLKELWLMGRQMQSVVIYGHRRMGKTSILRNAAQTVGAGLQLVYINMLRSASADSLSDVLIAMTDEIAAVTRVPAPSDDELMAQPSRTFDRYLKRVLNRLEIGRAHV